MGGGRRGIVLMITLWVLVILSSVALTYAYYTQLDLQMTTFAANSARARTLAKAGYYRACVYLRDDKLKDTDLLDNDDLVELDDDDINYIYDAMNEEWYSFWWEEEEPFRNISFEGETNWYEEDEITQSFMVNVEDEAGKININIAHQDLIKNLLIVTGVEEEYAKTVAAAIIDWRDSDTEPSEGGEEGDVDLEFGEKISEDTYYNPGQTIDGIQTEGPDYVTKNAPIDDVEELLLVFGMNPYIFYGEDANGNRKVDPNERDGSRLPPDDDGDDNLLIGIQPFITVYSSNEDDPYSGALNINTAPKEVLQALFMCIEEIEDDDAEDIAEDIVDYRLGGDGEPGTRDDRPFRTLDDSDMDDIHITKASNAITVDDLNRLQQFHRLGVSSDVFRIISIGRSNDIERKLDTVVRRRFTEPLELEGDDMDRDDDDDDDKEKPEAVQLFVLRQEEEGI